MKRLNSPHFFDSTNTYLVVIVFLLFIELLEGYREWVRSASGVLTFLVEDACRILGLDVHFYLYSKVFYLDIIELS